MKKGTPLKEAKMSLVGGLVDRHHETELTPSVQLIHSTWFARHLWTIMFVAASTLAATAWMAFHI
jgi:hypothetical protein